MVRLPDRLLFEAVYYKSFELGPHVDFSRAWVLFNLRSPNDDLVRLVKSHLRSEACVDWIEALNDYHQMHCEFIGGLVLYVIYYFTNLVIFHSLFSVPHIKPLYRVQ